MTVKWPSISGSRFKSNRLHHGYVSVPHVIVLGPYASIGQVESHCIEQKRCSLKYSKCGFVGYEVLPGKLPAFWDNELMMGMKMPPALAVVEGMAGAIAASANASPYAKPSVLLPKAFTNRVATRSPSPVFSKPCSRLID